MGYIFVLIFIAILFILRCSSFLDKPKRKLKEIFIWNSVIRMMLEGYFEIILALGIITIYEQMDQQSHFRFEVAFSNGFAIFLGIICLSMPFLILFFYNAKVEQW